jgi:hypothetical protein
VLRELGDREHVDQVEEQLHAGDPRVSPERRSRSQELRDPRSQEMRREAEVTNGLE